MSDTKETVILDNFKTIDITFTADTDDLYEAEQIARSYLKSPDDWYFYGAAQDDSRLFEFTFYQGEIRDDS